MTEVALNLTGPQYDFCLSTKALNLFHSGQGAGKTFAMGFISYHFVSFAPQAIGFIAANTYVQLSQSTLLEIFSVWKKYFDFIEGRDYVKDRTPPPEFEHPDYTLKTYMNTIITRNGALIFVGSLDNFKAHEGKSLGWALLDETKDTREVAVKDVILARLRQRGLYCKPDPDFKSLEFPYTNKPTEGAIHQNPLYIFTSPAKVDWLIEMFELEEHQVEIEAHIFSETDYFFKEYGNKCVVISSTYHNAANLPPDYIQKRMDILTEEKIDMNIYGSPFAKSGGEYYSAFDHNKHVKPCRVDPELPFHLTFDFNVNPYMTATVWQIVSGENTEEKRLKIRAIQEYALTAPKNTIEDVCSTFRAEYGHMINGLFYYGDATGKNRIPVKNVRNYFNVIKKELVGLVGPSSQRILSQNPRHQAIGKQTLGRRDFMNACFKGAYGFDIEIDPKCKHLIADLKYLKEDVNGGKDKKKEEINGVQAEKYGHMSDSMDAVFCFLFERYWR